MKKLIYAILATLLVITVSLSCFSVSVLADTASGTVGITNSAPTMGTATLWNQAGANAAITLSAGGTVVVTANVTVTDLNGGSNVTGASGTLFHSTSTYDGANDENIHITNSSCVLGTPSGNDVVASCTFTMNFMALDGTWTANITATDGIASVSGTDDNTVNTLAGLIVVETTIDFDTLALGANSSSAETMTVRSQGNIVIDAQYEGTTYTCTSGTIPVGNTRYSLVTGDYDSMSTDLTAGAVTQTSFDLGIRGVATANGANSDESEFWTILIPASGVSGACTNTLTVTAIASA